MIVEDGTGVPDADAYVDVAFVDAYEADVAGPTAEWTAADAAAKRRAIRKATLFLDGAYSFVGRPATADQGLEWPRVNAEPGEVLAYRAIKSFPRAVRQATADLALEAIKGVDLTPRVDAGGAPKREKVGPIEVERSVGASQLPDVTAARLKLRPYLYAAGRVLKG